jgi:DNA-binding CsgD family transcriptional regulator
MSLPGVTSDGGRCAACGWSPPVDPEKTPRPATIGTAAAVGFFRRGVEVMSDTVKLSRREHEALAYLVRGFSNREIAASLGISPNTVNKHIQQIFAKLRVRNRVEAVTRALQLETISLSTNP